MPLSLPTYLCYLLLTFAVEVPVVFFALMPYCSGRRAVLGALLASLLTHPLLWFAWPLVVPVESYTTYVATGEVAVVVVEAIVLWGVALGFVRGRFGVALGTSLLANGLSFLVGYLLQAIT